MKVLRKQQNKTHKHRQQYGFDTEGKWGGEVEDIGRINGSRIKF